MARATKKNMLKHPCHLLLLKLSPNCREVREEMKRVLEDHQVLKGYVDFIRTQFHKAIDDEQTGHDKQVLRTAMFVALEWPSYGRFGNSVSTLRGARERASCEARGKLPEHDG